MHVCITVHKLCAVRIVLVLEFYSLRLSYIRDMHAVYACTHSGSPHHSASWGEPVLCQYVVKRAEMSYYDESDVVP